MRAKAFQMPRINLLYVITKLELGGAQKHLLDLIGGLDKEKFNIFLLTAQSGLLIPEAFRIPGVALKRSLFLERPVNPFKDFLALIEIYYFIKKSKIQLVHTHSSKAGILARLAAKLAKVSVIIHTVHGWSFNDCQPGWISQFNIFLERFCAAFTSKLIVVSSFDQEKGLSNAIGKKDQYALVRYGIDSALFDSSGSRQQARTSFGITGGELAVGMVACFKPQKAPLDFIELAREINKDFPDVKFILAGDGCLRRQITRRIEKYNLGSRVILAGWRRDIPFILSGLDVFVLTSLWEGLPIVVLEAMAAGVALVATDTGGIAEVLISGQTGYLVKPHDLAGMRRCLSELLGSREKRKQFSEQSRITVQSEEFQLSRMLKATCGIYADLLSVKV